MKRFITYISMQPENHLKKVRYQPVDDMEIRAKKDVYFPISLLVDNYAPIGGEIEILCLKEKENADIERNLELLKGEIAEILDDRSVNCTFREILINPEEKIDTHLATFAQIIDHIKDEDTVYACATYGTKPIPIIEMMALDYAYRVKKDVTIGSVVYGKIDRRNNDLQAKLYDITALFFMSQIVGRLAEQKVADPEEKIRQILGLGADE